MAQACGRVMAPGSSIINISSVLGITTAGLPQAAYAASKAGLIGLTRDLANQWTGRKGIRVNAIAPGFFESEMTQQYPPGYLDAKAARIPTGRRGTRGSWLPRSSSSPRRPPATSRARHCPSTAA
jgi:NAD(P)-dependent dehydrogenase (short-subunit alcohol dehydrogenase family)